MESEEHRGGESKAEKTYTELAAEHNGETRRKIIHRLDGKVDFIGSMANDLDRAWQTIYDHIQKLLADDLVERVSSSTEESERANYTLTDKGQVVAERIPEG